MSQPRRLVASPWFIGVASFALLYWVIDLVVLRAGVPHPLDDSWEDGIVARLLLHGDWFRTHMIFPALWEFRDPRTLTLPVLVHGPLVPLILTVPLALFGSGALDHVAWIAAGFAMLTLVPLFRLTSRLFDEWVAAAAAILFTLSPLTVAAVDHYLTVVLGAFMLVTVLDLLARERPRAGLAGVIAGLGYLARPEMLIAAPVLAFLAASARRRAAWIFLLGFVVSASWWWLERWRSAGSPFFNLSSYLLICFSPAHPGDSLVRDFSAQPGRFAALLTDAWPGLWRKWMYFAPRAVKRALTMPSGGTSWLMMVGAASVFRQRATRRVGISLTLLALMPLAMITVLVSERLYPVPFLPIYCIAAAVGARLVLSRLPEWLSRPRTALALLLVIMLPSALMELRMQTRDARSTEQWLARDRSALASSSRTPANATRLLFSDTPDFVAWTTGRPTLWLKLEEFERQYEPGRAVPAGLPARPDSADTWFHHGSVNDPTGQTGFRLGAAPRVSGLSR